MSNASDPQPKQAGSDAALPRRKHMQLGGETYEQRKAKTELESERARKLCGEVVSYRRGEKRPQLPPGHYDYDREGDRW